jgi:hypothetical protein
MCGRALVACLASLLLAAAQAAAAPLAFRDVAPGIAYAAFEAEGEYPLQGHAFVVDLARVDLRLLQGGPKGEHAEVGTIAAPFPVHLATNASFFDEHQRAMGRVVDRGKTLVADRRRAWGALVVEGGSARIATGDSLPERVGGGELVVQGIPRLVVDGVVQRLKPAVAQRTAVCADGGQLVLVVTTSPADVTEFARFLALPRRAGGLGCRNALNLDGGPSTQLHASLPGLRLVVRGGWAVPNALVVAPR